MRGAGEGVGVGVTGEGRTVGAAAWDVTGSSMWAGFKRSMDTVHSLPLMWIV